MWISSGVTSLLLSSTTSRNDIQRKGCTMNSRRSFTLAFVVYLLWVNDGTLGRPTTTTVSFTHTSLYTNDLDTANDEVEPESVSKDAESEVENNLVKTNIEFENSFFIDPQHEDIDNSLTADDTTTRTESGAENHETEALGHNNEETLPHIMSPSDTNFNEFISPNEAESQEQFVALKRNDDSNSELSARAGRNTAAPVHLNVNLESNANEGETNDLPGSSNEETLLNGPGGGYVDVHPGESEPTPRQTNIESSQSASAVQHDDHGGTLLADTSSNGMHVTEEPPLLSQPQAGGNTEAGAVPEPHQGSQSNTDNAAPVGGEGGLAENHEVPLETQGTGENPSSALDHPIDIGTADHVSPHQADANPSINENSDPSGNNSDGEVVDTNSSSENTDDVINNADNTNETGESGSVNVDEVAHENEFNSSSVDAGSESVISGGENVPLIIAPGDQSHKNAQHVDQNETQSIDNGNDTGVSSGPSHSDLNPQSQINPSQSLADSSTSLSSTTSHPGTHLAVTPSYSTGQNLDHSTTESLQEFHSSQSNVANTDTSVPSIDLRPSSTLTLTPSSSETSTVHPAVLATVIYDTISTAEVIDETSTSTIHPSSTVTTKATQGVTESTTAEQTEVAQVISSGTSVHATTPKTTEPYVATDSDKEDISHESNVEITTTSGRSSSPQLSVMSNHSLEPVTGENNGGTSNRQGDISSAVPASSSSVRPFIRSTSSSSSTSSTPVTATTSATTTTTTKPPTTRVGINTSAVITTPAHITATPATTTTTTTTETTPIIATTTTTATTKPPTTRIVFNTSSAVTSPVSTTTTAATLATTSTSATSVPDGTPTILTSPPSNGRQTNGAVHPPVVTTDSVRPDVPEVVTTTTATTTTTTTTTISSTLPTTVTTTTTTPTTTQTTTVPTRTPTTPTTTPTTTTSAQDPDSQAGDKLSTTTPAVTNHHVPPEVESTSSEPNHVTARPATSTVTSNNAIHIHEEVTIKPDNHATPSGNTLPTPEIPVGGIDLPPSFVELKFGMSWPDFCDHEVSIRGELVEILHVQGGHGEVTADQIQVINREQEECYQLNFSVTEEILVHLYLVNKSHHYDRGLTLVCAQILASAQGLGETSIIRNKLIEVRFHDEYYITPATGASIEKGDGEDQASSSVLADPGVTIAIVLAVVGGCCCVGLIAIQIIVRRRNKDSPVPPGFNRSFSVTSADSIQLASVNKSRPNSGLFNPGLDLSDPPDPTHPLNFTQLANFCMDNRRMEAEYQKLPNRMPRLSVVPPGDEDKNRYANVLPLVQTRVKLFQDGPEPRSSYINANFVTGPNNQCQYYIATQAPVKETIADFWTMIWQQGSKAIVMLTQMEEDGQSKCAPYWPDLVGKSAAQKHGDFLIELKQKEVFQEYIASRLEINNLRKIEKREIDHFWYTCWPSNGMPEPISLVKLVLDTRPKYEGSGSPLVVHCSPGTGRTCTFIALDLCMRQFEARRIVDVMKTVYAMRQERAGAIQNKEQYALLYNAIYEYAVIVVSPVVSAASSATTLHALLPS